MSRAPSVPVDAPTAAKFSMPSIVAGISGAIALFNPGWLGLLLAIVAMVAGILGIVVALSPRVRGGIVSLLGIGVGAIAIVLSVLKIFLGAIF